MTDIREKVAREMYRAAYCRNGEPDDWHESPPEIRENMMREAGAALLACGYAEMRKALETAPDLPTGLLASGDGFEKRVREWFNRYMDWQFDYHAAARSILERTGEK